MAVPWVMDIIDFDADRTTDPNIVSGSNLNLVAAQATQIGMALMPCEKFKACFLDCCRIL